MTSAGQTPVNAMKNEDRQTIFVEFLSAFLFCGQTGIYFVQ